uniref:Uncharacterized protein n=1 Tax=Strongyloides papillosus TaxID=174720 RepID=A0A0N5BZ44_STREA
MNSSIECFMPTPDGPTLCEKINDGDIVTVTRTKIKYDDIKSPQNQSKITVSTDIGISSGLSTPQTKSINTSTNSNFKETASKTKVNDYIISSKRTQPVILKESSPYFEEPCEKKSKSDKLCDFIVWVIESTKENDKENWHGMSIDDIITFSLLTRELVCEAIKDLALNRRIRTTKPNIYDLFD